MILCVDGELFMKTTRVNELCYVNYFNSNIETKIKHSELILNKKELLRDELT